MNRYAPPERILPETDADRAKILNQLERILADPQFSGSKRYSALLRYVVERALNVPPDDLKERTIGISVFGRQPSYDTSVDPIVRVAAGEVRKRLNLYYHGPGRDSEILIQMPSGAYDVQFFTSAQSTSALPEQPASSAPLLTESGEANEHRGRFRRLWMYSLLVLSALLLLSLGVILPRFVFRQPDRASEFWAPFLNRSSTTLICLGDINSFKRRFPLFPVTVGPLDGSVGAYFRTQDEIYSFYAINSTTLAVKIASAGGHYRLTTSHSTSLTDLLQGPVILVGGLDNDWTMRVLDPLRFSLGWQPLYTGLIVDHRKPNQTNWSVPFGLSLDKFQQDYGLIARLRSTITDKPVMVVAGLSVSGNTAAEELVTNPQALDQLLASAPPGWQNMNMEAVISTEVIEGRPGPPKVVAIQYW